MDFPIPPELARAVHERVRSGQYASTDEVLRAMLDALEGAEALRAEIQIGLDQFERGEVVDGAEEIARLKSWLDRKIDRERLAADFHDEQLTEEERDAVRHDLRLFLEREEMAHGDREAVTDTYAGVRGQAARNFVEEKLEAGEYQSVSDLLEAAVHALMEAGEDDWDPADLGRELKIGKDSLARGEGVPASEAVERMMCWREEDAA